MLSNHLKSGNLSSVETRQLCVGLHWSIRIGLEEAHSKAGRSLEASVILMQVSARFSSDVLNSLAEAHSPRGLSVAQFGWLA